MSKIVDLDKYRKQKVLKENRERKMIFLNERFVLKDGKWLPEKPNKK